MEHNCITLRLWNGIHPVMIYKLDQNRKTSVLVTSLSHVTIHVSNPNMVPFSVLGLP